MAPSPPADDAELRRGLGHSGPGHPTPDDIERAHLRDPTDRTFTIARYDVSAQVSELARRFWIPVWRVPPGREAPQRVLQYPVCLVVVADRYARCYGVVSGLSTTTLTGRGWALGVMLQPAAGHLLTGGSVADLTDRYVDLTQPSEVRGTRGLAGLADVVAPVRAAMSADPNDPAAHTRARELVEGTLAAHLPVDQEGRLVNAIVQAVESDPTLLRVADLCDRFDLGERALQRLTARRLGLSPKWLIRRRRLHEAAGALRDPDTGLAALAADLGYTDQAHLTRDFRAATGLTPGRFARRFTDPAG